MFAPSVIASRRNSPPSPTASSSGASVLERAPAHAHLVAREFPVQFVPATAPEEAGVVAVMAGRVEQEPHDPAGETGIAQDLGKVVDEMRAPELPDPVELLPLGQLEVDTAAPQTDPRGS